MELDLPTPLSRPPWVGWCVHTLLQTPKKSGYCITFISLNNEVVWRSASSCPGSIQIKHTLLYNNNNFILIVYVAGGFNGEVILSSVECYNPKIDSWTSMPNMTTRRSGHEMVAGAGSLFCLGGFDGSARLSSCERFSFQTKRWDKIASMKSPRSNFASAVIGNTIIVSNNTLFS